MSLAELLAVVSVILIVASTIQLNPMFLSDVSLLLRLLLVLLLDLPMQMINRRRACICQVRTRNVIVAQVLKRLHVLGLVTCIVTMMVQGIAELNLIQGLVVGGRGGERDHLFQWAGVWCGQLEYAVARMGATSKPRLTDCLIVCDSQSSDTLVF